MYQGVADCLTGLCRLAGRKDLAERIRPTSRTVSGADEGPEIELEEEPEAGAPVGTAPADSPAEDG